jgi:hypothetical protein
MDKMTQVKNLHLLHKRLGETYVIAKYQQQTNSSRLKAIKMNEGTKIFASFPIY